MLDCVALLALELLPLTEQLYGNPALKPRRRTGVERAAEAAVPAAAHTAHPGAGAGAQRWSSSSSASAPCTDKCIGKLWLWFG